MRLTPAIWAFAIAFGWRVLDELIGHLVFRIGGPMARQHERRESGR